MTVTYFWGFHLRELYLQNSGKVEEHQLPENRLRNLLDIIAYTNLALLNQNYIYFITENKAKFYLYQKLYMLRPRLKMLYETFSMYYFSAVTNLYRSVRDKFNAFITNVFESGLYNILSEYTICEEIFNFYPAEVDEPEPFDLEYMVMPAITLIVGYLIVFISCICEVSIAYFD